MYCRASKGQDRGCEINGLAGRDFGWSKSMLSWQEWQGSNLRPPVLETGALPIELHSSGNRRKPAIRAVSSIGHARIARVKRANALFKPQLLRQTSLKPQQQHSGETMNAQVAAQTRQRPQTPSLPQAKPESIGLSAARLQKHVGRLQARGRQGNPARRHRAGGAQGPGRLVRRDRPAEPDCRRADGARLHLPHLLDDQADRLGRHHDAGRGRPLPPQRSRRKIHSGVRQTEGRRREQRQARAGAARSGR